MMASFLPAIGAYSNSEQKEQQKNIEKYVFYSGVTQIHINPEKT